MDNVNAAGTQQISSFTYEWRISSFTFFSSDYFFSLFESDLDLRLRVAGSLSRGLPSFGAISLSRGLPSFEARYPRMMQGGGVVFSSCC